MSDIGEYFQAYNEHFRDIRRNCLDNRLKFLQRTDIDYQILNKGAGHVRITTEKARYDTWLGTGKWTVVGSNVYHQSWSNLLKQIDGDNHE